MAMTYVIHIAAGSLGIISGFIALYATKGATLHRRAGMVFFFAMLTMGLFGMAIAIVKGVAPAVNVPAGLLTAYLIVTGLATVRTLPVSARWLNAAGALVALGVGAASMSFAFEAFANGGKRDGMPPFPFLMFGTVALLGSAGDLRMMRSGAHRGAKRVARHLWRMSFALFIAALSFFIGQSKVFPEPIRILPLLAVPVLAVLVTMFYWLWRVRLRQSLRGLVGVSAIDSVSVRT
jgi:hypothetical protein